MSKMCRDHRVEKAAAITPWREHRHPGPLRIGRVREARVRITGAAEVLAGTCWWLDVHLEDADTGQEIYAEIGYVQRLICAKPGQRVRFLARMLDAAGEPLLIGNVWATECIYGTVVEPYPSREVRP